MKRAMLLGSVLLMVLASTIALHAQDLSNAAKPKKHRFSIYAGMGPSFYFNNLEVSKQYVREFNFAFVTRFMWEPGHNLSLGLETGYNGLYSIKENPTVVSQVKISNAAIPIQLVISMKFLQDFYGSFTMGQSILLNKVYTKTPLGEQRSTATNLSLGDFGLAAGYKKSISPRLYLGAELKGFYSSKLDDKNLGLVFLTGYRF
jgi:hypothetical protein